jgi:hypothetical protein
MKESDRGILCNDDENITLNQTYGPRQGIIQMFGIPVESWVALFFVLLIFLVCRELVCWYWKINQATQLLRDILVELKKLNSEKRLSVSEEEYRKHLGKVEL